MPNQQWRLLEGNQEWEVCLCLLSKIISFRCLSYSFLVVTVFGSKLIMEIYRMKWLKAANVHQVSRVMAYTVAKVLLSGNKNIILQTSGEYLSMFM
jgi:hypothetical protein